MCLQVLLHTHTHTHTHWRIHTHARAHWAQLLKRRVNGSLDLSEPISAAALKLVPSELNWSTHARARARTQTHTRFILVVLFVSRIFIFIFNQAIGPYCMKLIIKTKKQNHVYAIAPNTCGFSQHGPWNLKTGPTPLHQRHCNLLFLDSGFQLLLLRLSLSLSLSLSLLSVAAAVVMSIILQCDWWLPVWYNVSSLWISFQTGQPRSPVFGDRIGCGSVWVWPTAGQSQ